MAGTRRAAEATIAQEFARKISDERLKARAVRVAPIIVILALMTFFGVLDVEFISLDNLLTILKQASIPLILAQGMTLVILMGSIDLSVEGAMALTGCLASVIVRNSKTGIDLGAGGIVIALAVGVLVGFVTGIIHVKAKLPSFMVSFGVSSIAAGLALLCYRGVPATITHPLFVFLNRGSLLFIPALTWVAAAIFAAVYVLLRSTAFGKHIYATGQDERIPRQVGINVDRMKVIVFMLSGFCIGLAGLLGLARAGRGDLLIGKGYLFTAITSVVVGGTVLSGGRGGAVSTLLGTLIVTILQNGLILAGVNPYLQAGIQGAIIVASVSVSATRSRKAAMK